MAKHHEPLQSLCPIDWDAAAAGGLDDVLAGALAGAQTVIDSIPVPASLQAATATSHRRPRSQTDPPSPSTAINRSLSTRQSGAALQQAQDLMKEWKDVKINARDNPLSINVYKLAAKDGRGAWFARRSVHDGLTFEKWKLGLEREFLESMKVQSGPGAGSIRGIGAEKRVEHHDLEGIGKAEVYQLSAQFPGPTAPRDFVTLLLTAETPHDTTKKGGKRPLRSYIIVSKPCDHSECPPRQGYIRGQYESVEIIREVPTEKPAIRRSMSSIAIAHEDPKARQAIAEDMSKEAVLRAAQKKAGDAPADEEDDEEVTTTIEWLMVTRSDPGGNVPRFMIERGTPGGIVSDAGKFLKWLNNKAANDFASENDKAEADEPKKSAVKAEDQKEKTKSLAPEPTANLLPDKASERTQTSQDSGDTLFEYPSSNGLYGMISGAIGYASSAVAQRLPIPVFFQSANNSSHETIPEVAEDDGFDSDTSDTSSIRSFASAVEGNESDISPPPVNKEDSVSVVSDESTVKRSITHSATSHYERDMKKLQDRRHKMQEKMNKLQSRITNKHAGESEKDAAAMAKLREKHDRDVAKQEEKYRRELRRLEEKRDAEQRKAQERRKKQAEREDKANISMELEKARAERDLAFRQVELLKLQVGELQSQNTKLVAEMGRMKNSASPEGRTKREALSRRNSSLSAASSLAGSNTSPKLPGGIAAAT
ncbi:hypothetical protein F5X68DRAFT_49279 [Plectosphaerella plurivora]|uniref:DUF3074 domain-containing protein n=1 Tax=Plectosphaerella plurivora TaxID=936078 RepID=A0A9P8VI62_9PEZI|nr:hypothetical protein F5X68DRAFT_49279 [Plectosphaerella plurivora]